MTRTVPAGSSSAAGAVAGAGAAIAGPAISAVRSAVVLTIPSLCTHESPMAGTVAEAVPRTRRDAPPFLAGRIGSCSSLAQGGR